MEIVSRPRRRGQAGGGKPTRLLRETYLAVIRGSPGTRMFRHVYALIGERPRDLIRSGDLACAFFVSSVLRLSGLSRDVHLTVAATVRDLQRSGWRPARRPWKPGTILVWEGQQFREGSTGTSVSSLALARRSARVQPAAPWCGITRPSAVGAGSRPPSGIRD